MGKKEEKYVLQSIFVQAVGARSLLYILGFIFSTTWIATIIYDISKKYLGDNLAYTVLLISALLILLALFIYSKKLKLEFSADDNIDINAVSKRSKKVLILFLSTVHNDFYNTLTDSINKETIDKWLSGHNSWKMPYSSINGHKSTLEKIYILTSPESSRQYNQFKKLINKSHKREFEMKELLIQNINDIEEYNSIFNKIYSECKILYSENDIVIDATSGTKLFSIAGGYFALSSEKIIQYINTSNYKVYQFNNRVLDKDSK